MLVEMGESHGRRRWCVKGAGRILAVFTDPETGRLIVTDGRCPHAGAPMQDGWLHDGAIVCPWHRYRFGPRDGACENNPGYRLAIYPTFTDSGRVVADVPFNPLGTSQYRPSQLRE